ncbi:hypothetical protein ACN4EK_32105, partial [Pantanalinema rosaneae CENA516]|uniref:hypothetical protein n=1 Tax=Pantanalinema rosaneae TaxID=1620701 RepID=UPI003D6E0396
MAIGIDQANPGDRGIANLYSQIDQIIKGRFWICIKDVVLAQGKQTSGFVVGVGRGGSCCLLYTS